MPPPAAHFAPLVIRASAGTGKTFQLSNRLIGLMAAGELPDRLLATTFTRKAAGQILQRVVQRLAHAATDDQACNQLADHIDDPSLTPKRCGELLRTLVQKLHRLNICTLDSFFARITGSFALELDLPAGWRIVEEVVDHRLRNEAIAALLREDDPQDMVNLMRLLHRDQPGRPVHEQIERVVDGLYSVWRRTTAETWQWIEATMPLDEIAANAAVQALPDLPLPDNRYVVEAARKDYESAVARDWATFLSKGLAAKVAARQTAYRNWTMPDEVVAVYQRLVDHAYAVLLGRIDRQTRATFDLLQRFDVQYRRLKRAARAMHFDDVTEALARGAVLEQIDEVYYRLDGRVRHLLLDEFQDTSLEQWAVLEPIAHEVLAQAGPDDSDRSFFCVGDVKQAIYGWRGGMAEIFDTLDERWPHLESWPMQKSFRSAQPIIDTVNQVFTDLADNKALARFAPAPADWAERFDHHTTAKTDLAGYARLLVAPAPEEGQSQGHVTLRAAAKLVRQIVEQAPGYSVGVLVRRNAAVARLIYELRRPEIGIRASEEGGNALTDSPAVSVIMSLLRLADHPADTAACYHVAQSPVGGLVGLHDHADDRQARRVASEVRHRLLEAGYGPTLYDWASQLAGACDGRDLKRLLQLVELGYQYEPDATVRPADFVRYVESHRIEDPTSADVRVMTVHQAKGLQFDVVVLPELDVLLGRVAGHAVLADREFPAAPPRRVCCYPPSVLRSMYAPFQQMYDQAVGAAVREELSVLYVAMTRAAHALYLLIAPSTKNERSLPGSYAGTLRAALADGQKATPRTGMWEHGDRNWFDMQVRPEQDTAAQAPFDSAIKVDLAPPPGRRSRGLVRQAPSDLEGGRHVDLRRRLRLDAEASRQRGSIIHAWFELIEWLDDGPPDEAALHAAVPRTAAAGVDINALITEFTQMIERPAIRDALSRSAYSHFSGELQVHREQPFAWRKGDTLMSGTFDRVIVNVESDQVTAADVLDFKTDMPAAADPEAVDALVEHYRPQLTAYQQAVAATHDLPADRVTAKLLLVVPGIVRSM